MTLPSHSQKILPSRAATAPYNFVPLPERVVMAVPDACDLPPHDSYSTPGYPNTGWLDVTLTTCSPLYIRGGLSTSRLAAGSEITEWALAEEQKAHQRLETKFRDQMKNKPDFFHTQDPDQPVLPGSSLRGMLRGLMEIASYGKMNRISDSQKIFFRAVAAPGDDPLARPYEAVIGKFGRNIHAGYLSQRDGDWYVQPAAKIERKSFTTIKEAFIPAGMVPGIKMFNDKGYTPGYYETQFILERYTDSRGQPAVRAVLVPSGTGRAQPAILVSSGNMLETGGMGPSPRKKHILVCEVENAAKKRRLAPQAVADYLAALTAFQRKAPFDDRTGCLVSGRPIFYVEPTDGTGDVYQFGHTPNFRAATCIRLQTAAQTVVRAATVRDFVPSFLRRPLDVDYADALFGFVRSRKDFPKDALPKQGHRSRAYAGRVSVTDAVLNGKPTPDQLWLMGSRSKPLEPQILASPKPTAFQHYLVQETDQRQELAHYNSLTPQKTVVRGYKLYLRRGDRGVTDLRPPIDDPNVDVQGLVKATSTQHTRMSPVRSGNSFQFRVYFENLSDAELGALCWTLHPLGDPSRNYVHSLGMGKPLGMGAVKLDARLRLIDRSNRYRTLFSGDEWSQGISGPGEVLSDRATLEARTQPFEKHILQELYDGTPPSNVTCLRDLERIGILLKMLEWQPGLPDSTVQTLTLEAFKGRLVLPSPAQKGDMTGTAQPPAPPNDSLYTDLFGDDPAIVLEAEREEERQESEENTRRIVASQEAERKAKRQEDASQEAEREAQRMRQAERILDKLRNGNSKVLATPLLSPNRDVKAWVRAFETKKGWSVRTLRDEQARIEVPYHQKPTEESQSICWVELTYRDGSLKKAKLIRWKTDQDDVPNDLLASV